jgi:small subunit ribosomal protein S16
MPYLTALARITAAAIDRYIYLVHNRGRKSDKKRKIMLRIRLRRVGAKKHPSYRLVVADIRAPRDGAFVDIIGHYDPMTDPETIVIQEEKALHWLTQGAKPSETTARLLGKAGILEKFKPVKEKS